MTRRAERMDAMLGVLRYAWGLYPDMRLGQLLINAAREEKWQGDIWNVEERDLIRGLLSLAAVTEKREQKEAWAAFTENVTPTIVKSFKPESGRDQA